MVLVHLTQFSSSQHEEVSENNAERVDLHLTMLRDHESDKTWYLRLKLLYLIAKYAIAGKTKMRRD